MQKDYSNKDIIVHWKPHLCIHSGICAMGLPLVFKPKERPWINMDAAETEKIELQVKKCPSGALSFSKIDDDMTDDNKSTDSKIVTLELMNRGPLLIKEPCILKLEDGTEKRLEKGGAICRCGHSSNKPFCDGTHRRLA